MSYCPANAPRAISGGGDTLSRNGIQAPDARSQKALRHSDYYVVPKSDVGTLETEPVILTGRTMRSTGFYGLRPERWVFYGAGEIKATVKSDVNILPRKAPALPQMAKPPPAA